MGRCARAPSMMLLFPFSSKRYYIRPPTQPKVHSRKFFRRLTSCPTSFGSAWKINLFYTITNPSCDSEPSDPKKWPSPTPSHQHLLGPSHQSFTFIAQKSFLSPQGPSAPRLPRPFVTVRQPTKVGGGHSQKLGGPLSEFVRS